MARGILQAPRPSRVIYVAYTLPGDLPRHPVTGTPAVCVQAFRAGTQLGERSIVGTVWIGAHSARAARVAWRAVRSWNRSGGPFDER